MDKVISNSLIEFFKTDVCRFFVPNSQKMILEIGCANYSVFENISITDDVIAIDKNIDAILNAPVSTIKYQASPIESFDDSDNKYDLIFDSHALHCILDFNSRSNAYSNIYRLLAQDGFFAAEVMINPANKIGVVTFPDRAILNAIDLENELLSHHFKIKYFMISPNLYFEESTGTNVKCDMLRFIAQK